MSITETREYQALKLATDTMEKEEEQKGYRTNLSIKRYLQRLDAYREMTAKL